MSKCILVRSPWVLVKEGWIGYGWSRVDFSSFSSHKDLIRCFRESRIDFGRSEKQIVRFFNIAEGDIVVVPVPGAILIGVSTGKKSYGEGVKHGSNRVSVDFFRNAEGNLVKVPRKSLSTAFSSRLRIRQSVVSLSEFAPEIEQIIASLKGGGSAIYSSHVQEMDALEVESFREAMLDNIRSGRTYLPCGGAGLEELVLELLKLDGYEAAIMAKKGQDGVADVDIAAFKTDFLSSTKLLIQVKHHVGASGFHGVKQIQAAEDEEQVLRWLITTAEVSDELREKAQVSNVNIMDGQEFSGWLTSHVAALSVSTRNKLGISSVPSLLIKA
ncbi:restriction system protein [Alkalispirochaeta americana]|uniref:Restriction system protein n=1 Tax=Alkalispirochaeta americana TaxID=159291 RepID=A0A1N6YGE6_9SPIO|nr:restriction endonuclease [Alkalispirochaeta americana]SIR13591.1 restriction system protein [Alkalispirochaeta americana]